ncbi:MAG: hypothetical protein NTW62_01235 [Candidatus Nomurabacteria bacterium]|nr:hypothetical protein [Candidatus Nomurabacteria bacterium]
MKTLFYNAGLITRRNYREMRIVRDMGKNNKIQIKIPGGMQEEGLDNNPELWLVEIERLMVQANFSKEQIKAILEFEELRVFNENDTFGTRRRAVTRELLEETGAYASKVRGLHERINPANKKIEGSCDVNQKFFFVEEYIMPLAGGQKFESLDKDVKGAAWICADMLLSNEVGGEQIIYTHNTAIRKACAMEEFSKEITIADLL